MSRCWKILESRLLKTLTGDPVHRSKVKEISGQSRSWIAFSWYTFQAWRQLWLFLFSSPLFPFKILPLIALSHWIDLCSWFFPIVGSGSIAKFLDDSSSSRVENIWANGLCWKSYLDRWVLRNQVFHCRFYSLHCLPSTSSDEGCFFAQCFLVLCLLLIVNASVLVPSAGPMLCSFAIHSDVQYTIVHT
jgi:hypothetical protein